MSIIRLGNYLIHTNGDGNFFFSTDQDTQTLRPIPIIDMLSDFMLQFDKKAHIRAIITLAIQNPHKFKHNKDCQALMDTIPDDKMIPEHRPNSNEEMNIWIAQQLLDAFNKMHSLNFSLSEVF